MVRDAIFLLLSSCQTCCQRKHRNIVQLASAQGIISTFCVTSLTVHRLLPVWSACAYWLIGSTNTWARDSQQQFRLARPQFESLCGRLSDLADSAMELLSHSNSHYLSYLSVAQGPGPNPSNHARNPEQPEVEFIWIHLMDPPLTWARDSQDWRAKLKQICELCPLGGRNTAKLETTNT
jgi:hypothetical protein